MSSPSTLLNFKQSPLIKDVIKQGRYKMHLCLAQYPELYIPYTHWRDSFSDRGEYGGHLLEGDTDIIIDGFPRSANSFAVSAFLLAQNHDIKVASHRHDPAQMIAAVKKNIPALLLIRDPKYTTISLIIHHYASHYAHASVKQMLKRYLHYYVPLLPYQNYLVIASFETVTNNFGSVISQVNHKFWTAFEPFAHNQENIKQCFHQLEEVTLKFQQKKKIINFEASVSRPSQQRDELKKKLLDDFSRPENQEIYSQACNLYQKFNSLAI